MIAKLSNLSKKKNALLHRIVGDSKVVSLNLDGNAIRTIQSTPFEYFNHLQSISVANNRITELNKGEPLKNNR